MTCDPSKWKNIDLFSPISPQLKAAIIESERAVLPQNGYWHDCWDRFKAHRFAFIAFCVLFGIIVMALIGPLLSAHSYFETRLHLKNLPPSTSYWFGTDELGRDLFTRCWWGARISLFVGITVAFVDLIIGASYGALSGFLGRKVDECMMRFADVLYAIPYLLVVILLMVVIGPGITTIILALTMTGWITMARIVRGQILQLKNQDFICAAYALGASRRRIVLCHLLPNAIGPMIVTLTFTIPTAIFAEAFLSFLGLGVQAPIASWGTMASDGLAALRFYPWRLFFPAALISLTILSLNMLGDGLRDVFDPRLKR